MGRPRIRCFSHLLEDAQREEVARNCKEKIRDISTIDPYKMETGLEEEGGGVLTR
jgi:hypothetical protein